MVEESCGPVYSDYIACRILGSEEGPHNLEQTGICRGECVRLGTGLVNSVQATETRLGGLFQEVIMGSGGKSLKVFRAFSSVPKENYEDCEQVTSISETSVISSVEVSWGSLGSFQLKRALIPTLELFCKHRAF